MEHTPTSRALGTVVVAGGANLDIVASARTVLQPAESNPGSIRCAPGGVARNVAHNLACLGHSVQLISALADDAFGRVLSEATLAAGVDMSLCLRCAGRSTGAYLSLHGPDGDMATAVNDMGLLDELTAAWLDTRQTAMGEALSRAAALVLDCNLAEGTLEWLIRQAGQLPVFVDAVSAHKAGRIRTWLHRVDTLKVNGFEAAALTGLPVRDLVQGREAARFLRAQGVREVVLSMGALGTLWVDAQGASGIEPVLPVPVRNTSGAGDALLAGLVHARLHGVELASALPFAHGCAALTVGVDQANHPELSVSAVSALLAQHSRRGDAQSGP